MKKNIVIGVELLIILLSLAFAFDQVRQSNVLLDAIEQKTLKLIEKEGELENLKNDMAESKAINFELVKHLDQLRLDCQRSKK